MSNVRMKGWRNKRKKYQLNQKVKIKKHEVKENQLLLKQRMKTGDRMDS